MLDFLIAFSVAMVFLCIYLISKCHAHSVEKELFEQVGFCVSSDSTLYRVNLSLIDYVHNAQIDLNIPQQYRIAGSEERAIVEDILCEFQADLIQRYFAGRLHPVHGRYAIPEKEYFMYVLCDFLLSYHPSPNRSLFILNCSILQLSFETTAILSRRNTRPQ